MTNSNASPPLEIGMVTVDCVDPARLAEFWSQALGTTIAFDVGEFMMLAPNGPGRPALGLQKVPEDKAGKNRVHMDLGTTERAREVTRLVGLGATVQGEHEVPGLAWTVLTDPEGNEFCVGTHHD